MATAKLTAAVKSIRVVVEFEDGEQLVYETGPGAQEIEMSVDMRRDPAVRMSHRGPVIDRRAPAPHSLSLTASWVEPFEAAATGTALPPTAPARRSPQ